MPPRVALGGPLGGYVALGRAPVAIWSRAVRLFPAGCACFCVIEKKTCVSRALRAVLRLFPVPRLCCARGGSLAFVFFSGGSVCWFGPALGFLVRGLGSVVCVCGACLCGLFRVPCCLRVRGSCAAVFACLVLGCCRRPWLCRFRIAVLLSCPSGLSSKN